MKDLQRAELEAGERCDEFNSDADHLTVIGGIEGMNTIITGIAAQVAAIQAAEDAQQHDYGEVSNEKEQAKEEMAKQVIKYALRGKVKAEQLGLEEIATALDRPKTYIFKADDVLAATRANDMKNLMNANKGPGGVLTNIIAGNITTMGDAIQAFVDLRNRPINIIKEKKADGTDLIQPEIDLLKGFIQQEIELLHSYLDDTDDANLVNQFELKSRAILLGRRHNIVLAHLVRDEDGGAITDGRLECERNGKFVLGNTFNDKYEIERIMSGPAYFNASAEGRIPVRRAITVEKGKMVEVTIRMVRG